MNNKSLLLIIFSLFLGSSCKNKQKEEVNKINQEVKITKSSKVSLTKMDMDTISKFTFVFYNDSIKQELFIFNQDIREEINFKLIYKDLTIEKFEIKGIAKIIEETKGEETISDDEGNGYFVNEYKFTYNNSNIIFRIDSEEFEAANVFERNSKQNKYDFFKSKNVMLNRKESR